MSRNFDTWNRYLDNKNKPLRGCVQFNVKGGNTVADIYDNNGTALANPILTDEYGRTEHQVFVNSDVVAYFYKYIGSGDFTSISSELPVADIVPGDTSTWALQYTAESVNDILAHITSDSVVCVPTIADLRELDVDTVPSINGVKVITLLGYDSIGDKEAVNYIWNPSLTDNDDNGAVIQGPALTGRWVMVKPVEHLDCRHYGIFPSNSMNDAVSMTPRMNQWIDYCNSVKVRPYFSAYGDYKFYKYTNLSITTEAIDIAPSVTFIDIGTSNIWNTEFNGNPYFYNHVTRLNSDYVKTSWGAYSFINPKHVVIDDIDNTFQYVYSGTTVDIDVVTNKAFSFTDSTVNVNKTFSGVSQFINCIINSKENISSGCYFTQCKLTEDMFIGAPAIHVDTTCIADMDDFLNKQHMWLLIKEQQQQVNYDWKGILTQENPWEGIIESDRWLINYKTINQDAELYEGNDAHTYYFENCTGALELQGKAANTYIFKDCELTLNFDANCSHETSVIANNSTLSIITTRHKLANLICTNSTLNGTGGWDANNVSILGSNLIANVYAGYADVKDSNISGTLQVYGLDYDTAITVDPDPASTDPHATYEVHRIVAGNIVNNYVNGFIIIGAYDQYDEHYAQYNLVRGLTIKDNIGISINPIKVGRTESCNYDNYNIYTYTGNTGTLAMKTSGTALVYQGATYWPATQSAGFLTGTGNANIYAWTLRSESGTEYNNAYAYEAKLFTIGIYNVNTKVQSFLTKPSDSNTVNSFIVSGANFALTNKAVAEGATVQSEQMIKLSDQFSWGVKFSGFGCGWIVGSLQSTPAKFDYEVVQV